MTTFMRRASLLMILALVAMPHHARASGEDSLAALRAEVARLSPMQNREMLGRLAEAASHITECPDVNPEPYGLIEQLGDTVFKHTNVETGNGTHCFYLLSPVHRPLSVAEARDFQAALMIGMTPKAQRRSATQESMDAGTAAFEALRLAIADGRARPMSMNAPDGSPIVSRSPQGSQDDWGQTGGLRDCSQVPASMLEEAAGTVGIGFVYNANYEWKIVPVDEGECVYLIEPIHRGLGIDEARDFLKATVSEMDAGIFSSDDKQSGYSSTSARRGAVEGSVVEDLVR